MRWVIKMKQYSNLWDTRRRPDRRPDRRLVWTSETITLRECWKKVFVS